MLEKQIVGKALVNSGIGYALAPAAQAVYDYTKVLQIYLKIQLKLVIIQ